MKLNDQSMRFLFILFWSPCIWVASVTPLESEYDDVTPGLSVVGGTYPVSLYVSF